MQSLARKPEAPQIRVLLKLYLVHLLEMKLRSQPLRALSLKLLISDELCTSREATCQCRPLHTAEKEEVVLVESFMGKEDLQVEEKGATPTSTASASSATSMATRR